MIERSYLAVFHKDENSDFGVSFPEVQGCFSAGETEEEAIKMAKEALKEYLEWLLEEGEPLPPYMGEEEALENLAATAFEEGFVTAERITVEIEEPARSTDTSAMAEKRRSIRLEELAVGRKQHTLLAWVHGLRDSLMSFLMFLSVAAMFAWGSVVQWLKAKTQTLKQDMPQGSDDEEYLRAVRTHISDNQKPQWLRDEQNKKRKIDAALKNANPGILISCDTCPFRIMENVPQGFVIGNSWASIEELPTMDRVAERFKQTMSVCAHPANGKWGPTRCGAFHPDEQTCPRALLTKMNPVRRIWWQYKMKKHLKTHGLEPKILD